MSNYIVPYAVKDQSLRMAEMVQFPVYEGARQQVYNQIVANSADSTQMQFNCNVTSVDDVVDRDVRVKSTIQWQMTISKVPVGQACVRFGYSTSLQSLPLNGLFTNITTTINSVPFVCQTNQIKGLLERLLSTREWHDTIETTPTLDDGSYYNFSDGMLTTSNPLASYSNAGYDTVLPRGAYPIKINSVLHTSPGVANDSSIVSNSVDDVFVLQCQTTVTEPLLCSPWLFSASNKGVRDGISKVSQAINIQMTIDGSLRRLLSSSLLQTTVPTDPYYCVLAPGSNGNGQLFVNPYILMRTLSPPSTSIPLSMNVHNSLNYQYNSAGQSTTTLQPYGQPGSVVTLVSNSLSLTSVPDFIVVCGRKQFTQQTISDSNSFMKINSVSVQFGTSDSLLSGASPEQLYLMSKRNGLNMSWLQFSGFLYENNTGAGGITAGDSLPSTGSILVMRPPLDFNLGDGITSGVAGTFLFQIRVTFENQTDAVVPCELCVLTAYPQILTFTDNRCEVQASPLSQLKALETSVSGESVPATTGAMDMVGAGRKRLARRMRGGGVQVIGGGLSGLV